MTNIHENVMQKLDELNISIISIANENNDSRLHDIALQLTKIKKMFLEEERASLEEKKATRKMGGIITSNKCEDLDRGFGHIQQR